VGNATHYHTVWVAPYWSPGLVKIARIGAHIFYRWDGSWGAPRAFAGQYAGDEASAMPAKANGLATPIPVSSPAAPELAAIEAAPVEKVQLAQTTPALKPAPAPAAPPEVAIAQNTPTKPRQVRLAAPSGW
jgi:hypothetical protein